MLIKKPLVSKVKNETPPHILELRKLRLNTRPYRTYTFYSDALSLHGDSQALVIVTTGSNKGIYDNTFKLISTWL